MEDDGLCAAFSPIAIPVKAEHSDGATSTSKQSPLAVNVVKDSTSAGKSNGSRRCRRKRKTMDQTEESLEQFVVRRKRAKKRTSRRKQDFNS